MKIILRIYCFLLLATFTIQQNNESTTVEPLTTMITLNASTTESSASNSTLSTTIASNLENNVTQATTTPVPKEDFNATKEIKKTVLKNRGHLNTSDYNCECDLMVRILWILEIPFLLRDHPWQYSGVLWDSFQERKWLKVF